ncbi:GNAT family N-acetyltransferase [Ornithinibacillus salinisoli]|uniref:GNAT family N-acetyltransferase n=1 Tax=Ornithinibacillus salinisoli TaxID=1848459 RepID=A0ABW4VTT3_9BACI
MTNAFKAIMANEQNMFFVVKDNKESVGYVWAEVRNYKENAFRKGYQAVFVHQICVNQTDRKNGYGSKLMERVYQIAENNNIDIIELDYWIGNDVMERFCTKHAFKKHREFVFKRMDWSASK